MKKIDSSYLGKKINKLNKKIHRAEEQGDENKVWWRKIKLGKLKEKLNNLIKSKNQLFQQLVYRPPYIYNFSF